MQHTEKEYLWLKYTREALNNQYETLNNVSWAAYHASSEPQQSHVICPNSLLPLFREPAHTLAMIKHSFNVIKSAIDHLRTGQISTVKTSMWSCLVAFTLKWQF